MMTVEDDKPHALPYSKYKNPFQKKAKELAQIQIIQRELTEAERASHTQVLAPTMEYTISFRDVLKENREAGYSNITLQDDPTAAENFRFQDDCNAQRLQHESTLLHVGEMILQRHTALYEHALLMKEQYQRKLAYYQARSPTFIFRYDTTRCCTPESNLDPGDFQYLIQMARYYVNLSLHLDEAYRIFKRCTYYHQQIRALMKREAVLRNLLGQRGSGYEEFTEKFPYNKEVTFATHTEAFVRTHRNQWAQRVHDLQEFLYHWKGHPTREGVE